MQPLKGITVVTLEHAIAAPFATRQLADLGARVIKIERPGSGDFARGYDERVRGLASHFVWTNRSKESLTLDVKHPQAAALLQRLIVEKADVVVQNLAPGAAERLGVSFDQLKARRPDLQVELFRGNLGTRLAKLGRGEVDATLLAMAGLVRLGMADRAVPLAIEEWLPAASQGAIAIEVHADNAEARAAVCDREVDVGAFAPRAAA